MQILPNNKISIKVIFEDEDIIIIDKPAGVPCLPLKDGETGTMANGVVARWGKIPPNPPLQRGGIREHPPLGKGGRGGFDSEIGILHRLDNDTSGCLLVAKNIAAYQNLRAQFDEGKILKRYTALVLGETPREGVIETPIIHDPKDKKKMKTFSLRTSPPVAGESRSDISIGSRLRSNNKLQSALTTYKLLRKYKAGQYSLLDVTIKTGVRHQIRVHLASIGHPIVGDKLYQNTRQRARDKTGLKRQFLHASHLGFSHPGGVEWVEFESPLPPDLRNVLTKLEKMRNG